MTRSDVTERIIEAKRQKGLSFKALAEKVGRSEVWTTAALLGQMGMGEAEARAAAQALGLDAEAQTLLRESPTKGSLDPLVPVDPLLYRFYEILQVYGTTIKALIHEKCGDGIMSAIDFEMAIERVADPKGDRIKVTMNGKFLPYRVW
ncbi:cyanase [Acidiferrobacter thiooxydans]|jgi:cyanate lyase|uniref:Cyanate hydratase n=1 Tax=Acidiferrobacter thiooxydans TaxID=163359 RepID=A0A1C2G014_9GAMM|nr:cyanase [Acidiferrobacter thiooxydans]MDA8192248.1 cyanase [Gammaproteobacteria bacterium]RCN56959.1 cyanase [Acidiferrobacter thiooxydans]UEN99652.1 cyanase [Acidiferrobacter thiooxydans]